MQRSGVGIAIDEAYLHTLPQAVQIHSWNRYKVETERQMAALYVDHTGSIHD
jgi:hypothetical protein